MAIRDEIIGIIGIVVDELVIGHVSIVAVECISRRRIVIAAAVEIVVLRRRVRVLHIEFVLRFHYLIIQLLESTQNPRNLDKSRD